MKGGDRKDRWKMKGIVRERKGKGSMTGGRKDRGKMKGIVRERKGKGSMTWGMER